jgi:putative hemolysin
MADTLLTSLILIALFVLMYTVSAGALRVFALGEGGGRERRASAWRRIFDATGKEPRELLMAAELFNSLAFVAAVILICHGITRWCAQTGWPLLPTAAVALIAVWIVRALVVDILPKRHPRGENEDAVGGSRLAGLSLLHWLLGPLLRSAGWILRTGGGERRPLEREEIVERAIDTLAESAGMEEPVIEPDERAMIQGVIGLEDTEVREVMVPRVDIVAIDVRAPIDEVRRRTTEYGHSRLPVYSGTLDDIVGILYVKDLFCAAPDVAADWPALVRRAFIIPETKKVDALLEEFKRTRTHIAIVVDEFGGTAGLVTLEDILEEIVGEIEDEHERRRRPQIERDDDDVLHADGVVPLAAIGEAFDLELPDERFETIGGLIYDRVGGIPRVGQSFHAHGLAITIEEMDGQRIRRVRISRHHRDT